MRGKAVTRLMRTLGLLTVCAILMLPGAALAGKRACATASIQEPFVLPDGSEHEAGSLKICKLQRHYPSAALLVSYVDGQNVGMLLGTSAHNESAPDADPLMIFSRDPDGRLHLYGYVLREGGDVSTFTLHRPDRLRAAVRMYASTG